MVGTYLNLQSSLDSFFMQRCRYIARVEREVYPFSCCRRVSEMHPLLMYWPTSRHTHSSCTDPPPDTPTPHYPTSQHIHSSLPHILTHPLLTNHLLTHPPLTTLPPDTPTPHYSTSWHTHPLPLCLLTHPLLTTPPPDAFTSYYPTFWYTHSSLLHLLTHPFLIIPTF